MIIHKIKHTTDQKLTTQQALLDIDNDGISATWFTNMHNSQSVVHSHPYHEIIIPISGSRVQYFADGGRIEIGQKEMIFFPAGTYHSGKFNVDADFSERLVLQISAGLWREALSISHIDSLNWDKRITVLGSKDVVDWDFKGLIERMAQADYLEEAARIRAYTAQTAEFILLLDHCLKKGPVTSHSVTNPLIAHAVNYIQDNFTNASLSVTSIAQECFVSREHLSRLFKEYTMESVQAYLTNIRMEHFKRLIASGCSILQASLESGFPNYSSFVKIFRKLYGITPSKFQAEQISLSAPKKG